MKIYRQKLFSMIDPSIVSRFLGVLGGFIFKAKVLHWAAKGKDIHEYLDAFWKLLYDFQDAIAEGWMGIGGKFSASDIGFVVSEPNEPREFLREVEEKVLDFYELLPDDPRFKGLSGEVEGFIQEIQKYKYLFGLCYDNEAREEKEFSEKRKKSKSEKLETAARAGVYGTGILGIIEAKKAQGAQRALIEKYDSHKELTEAIKRAEESERKLKEAMKQTRLEDRLAKTKQKTGEITKRELEIALDRGKNSRRDIAADLKKLENTVEGKVLKGHKKTKAAFTASLGLSAAATGLHLYNKVKKKKSENK